MKIVLTETAIAVTTAVITTIITNAIIEKKRRKEYHKDVVIRVEDLINSQVSVNMSEINRKVDIVKTEVDKINEKADILIDGSIKILDMLESTRKAEQKTAKATKPKTEKKVKKNEAEQADLETIKSAE